MNDYCRKHVARWGEDVEGAFIDLGILPSLLGCKCTIVYLERVEGNEPLSLTNEVMETRPQFEGTYVR